MHPATLYADGDSGVPASNAGSSSGAVYGSSGDGGGFSDGSFRLEGSGAIPALEGVLDGFDDRSPGYLMNTYMRNDFRFQNATQAEDEQYRDAELRTTSSVYGSQSRQPIRHKTTPLMSALDLNEWYHISIQNPSSPEVIDPIRPSALVMEQRLIETRTRAGEYSPYIGPLYRGTYNLFRYNSRLNQPTQGDALATSCKRMVESENVSNRAESPEWQRLEMDNCTNQFILQQNARYSNMAHEEQSAMPSTGPQSCQPFRMIPPSDEDQEYAADWYYSVAWKKLLTDASFLARDGKAPKEPNYGNSQGPDNHHIRITESIPAPTGNFGRTELKDLATPKLQLERIADPSHPFSPRWDFEKEDRSYSPSTAAYGGNPTNAVRCMPNQPVDIMKWRETKFDRHITARIAFNIACFINKKKCWTPFRCTASEPCCATKLDGRDKVPTPWCNAGTPDPSMTANKLCQFLAKPVIPVNALKMRDSADTAIYPNGVPAGYKFESYFGKHRPYMRCWDTGQECGLPEGTSFDDAMSRDDGSRWAIMGAGREGQSCLIGGSKGRLGVPNVSPITDWMELKLYQVNAMRRGLFCLPRNDIINKPGDTEQLVLNSGGAAPQMRVPNPADGATDRYQTVPWPKAWRGYVMEPEQQYRFPNFGASGGSVSMQTGLDDAMPGDILVFDKDVMMSGARRGNGVGNDNVWRLPYVAYVTETDNATRRNGGDGSGGGGGGGGGGTPSDGVTGGPEFVRVEAHNHGKFPDACGNTTDMFMGESFTMYKDSLPDWIEQRLSAVGNHTNKCVDPALNDCIEPRWSQVKRYKIQEDIRGGGGG
ncbi:MAG: hypothetical protein K2Q12_03370 [Rickettsiales bacterium]|nr:hypothetical protein [Rickettsiales bacterium]